MFLWMAVSIFHWITKLAPSSSEGMYAPMGHSTLLSVSQRIMSFHRASRASFSCSASGIILILVGLSIEIFIVTFPSIILWVSQSFGLLLIHNSKLAIQNYPGLFWNGRA